MLTHVEPPTRYFSLMHLHGCDVLYPGLKFCNQASSFVPRREVLYPGMTFCTQAWSFVPSYEVLYPVIKFCTQLWNFILYFLCGGNEISCLGMNLHYWEWNFPHGSNTLEKPTSIIRRAFLWTVVHSSDRTRSRNKFSKIWNFFIHGRQHSEKKTFLHFNSIESENRLSSRKKLIAKFSMYIH
jgi:hypothetical protein